MSFIDALFAAVKMRCAICGSDAAIGACGCWERCRCGLWAVTRIGEERAGSLYVSRGCGNRLCSNASVDRGCGAVWGGRRTGRLCVLPIGHDGRHRYTIKAKG